MTSPKLSLVSRNVLVNHDSFTGEGEKSIPSQSTFVVLFLKRQGIIKRGKNQRCLSHFLCLQNKVKPSVPISPLATLYSPTLTGYPHHANSLSAPQIHQDSILLRAFVLVTPSVWNASFFTDVCMAASTHHLGIILSKRTSPTTPRTVVLPPPYIFLGHSTSHCSILVSPQHLTVSKIIFCVFMGLHNLFPPSRMSICWVRYSTTAVSLVPRQCLIHSRLLIHSCWLVDHNPGWVVPYDFFSGHAYKVNSSSVSLGHKKKVAELVKEWKPQNGSVSGQLIGRLCPLLNLGCHL